MTIHFQEYVDPDEEGISEKERAVRRRVKEILMRPGANIMVMGIGGAGRNAIRNFRKSPLSQVVHLMMVDTDIGSDRLRYGKERP